MNNPQFRASFNGHFSQPPPPPYRFPGHFTGQNSGATTGGNALGQFFGGTFGGQFPNGAPGGWQQQQQGPISGQFGSGMTGGGWQNAAQFVETFTGPTTTTSQPGWGQFGGLQTGGPSAGGGSSGQFFGSGFSMSPAINYGTQVPPSHCLFLHDIF